MGVKTADELQAHMLGTYFGLRVGLAAVAVALPIALLGVGRLVHGVGLQGSLSAYYHVPARIPFFTPREVFVGGLFAAAVCLYLYKGFSTRENVALNLGAVFAVLVALFPTVAPGEVRGTVGYLHIVFAVLFFLCIAYVSLFRARDTLRLLPPEKRPTYRQLYFWTGVMMVASPLVAIAASLALEGGTWRRAVVFWLEAFAVWAFAAYWITKTREMRWSQAEKRAADADLEREVVPTPAPDRVAEGRMARAIHRILMPRSGEVERVLPVDSTQEAAFAAGGRRTPNA